MVVAAAGWLTTPWLRAAAIHGMDSAWKRAEDAENVIFISLLKNQKSCFLQHNPFPLGMLFCMPNILSELSQIIIMNKSWRHTLFINSSVALASAVVSSMIISISHHYSLGLLFIIIIPLPSGFLTSYLFLCLFEGGNELSLIKNFWQTLLLGTTVALLMTVGFVCAISQHFAISPYVTL